MNKFASFQGLLLFLCLSAQFTQLLAIYGQGRTQEAQPKKIYIFDMNFVLFDTEYIKAAIKAFCYFPWIMGRVLRKLITDRNPHALIDAFAESGACQKPRGETWKAIAEIPQDENHFVYILTDSEENIFKQVREKYHQLFARVNRTFCRSSSMRWISKTSLEIIAIVNKKIAEDVKSDHISSSIVIFFDDQEKNKRCADLGGWDFVKITSDAQCAAAIREVTGIS